MKKILSTLLALSMTSLLGISILANDTDIKEHFDFTRDVLVGTTLVKKGRYLVKYDTTSRQMAVFDNGKMIVEVPASVRMAEKAFESDALLTADTGQGLKLTGLRLGGHHEELILGETVSFFDFRFIDFQIP